jgi:hypothetical protein
MGDTDAHRQQGDFISLLKLLWGIYRKSSSNLFIYLWLYSPFLDPGNFFSFLLLCTVGITPSTEDQPVARPLPTHRTIQTQNKRTQTSMPWVGLEPTLAAFERAKTVHALDRAATVNGQSSFNTPQKLGGVHRKMVRHGYTERWSEKPHFIFSK